MWIMLPHKISAKWFTRYWWETDIYHPSHALLTVLHFPWYAPMLHEIFLPPWFGFSILADYANLEGQLSSRLCVVFIVSARVVFFYMWQHCLLLLIFQPCLCAVILRNAGWLIWSCIPYIQALNQVKWTWICMLNFSFSSVDIGAHVCLVEPIGRGYHCISAVVFTTRKSTPEAVG